MAQNFTKSQSSVLCFLISSLFLFGFPRQANAQSNGCNNIPTTTPSTSTGTLGGPAGLPAGTWIQVFFGFSSASNTTSTVTVTTSGGASFGPYTWSCTQAGPIKRAFAYRTQVANETFTISEVDAGGAGAGFGNLDASALKADGCACGDSIVSLDDIPQTSADGVGLSGDPINVTTGNLFEVERDYLSPPNTRLEMRRYYNSLGLLNSGGFGALWQGTYDRSLYSSPGSNFAQYTRADGRVEVLSLSNGIWTADSDENTTLSPLPSSGPQTGWQVVTADDTIETYNLVGQLTSLTARGGLAMTLTYSGGQLMTVRGPFGQTLGFSYNAAGQRTQMTDAEGDVYTYAYDSHGNLMSVTYPDHSVRQYLYENISFQNALTGIIDENGNRFATWAYDGPGRANSSQHAGGADLTTISYTSGSSTVTNALGQQFVYKFFTMQSVPKITEIDRLATSTTVAASKKFTYDANGFFASATDWNGNLTTYANDARGEPTTITEASGTAQARITLITYHPSFHLPVSLVTPGLTTNYSYDANGNLLTRTLTDTTATIVPYSTNGTARTWTNTYGANFLISSITGPRTDVSQVTTLSYDRAGVLKTLTNAAGQVTTVTAHTPGGLPTTIIDANGVTTTLAYDARQRLLSSTVTTAGGPLTTSWSYDAAGNLTKTILPDGSALTNAYDNAHRLTGITDLFNQSVAYTLDALGNRTQTNVANASASVQQQHSATFDALGRILQDIGGVGQTTKYTYDSSGNALTVTDPLNHAAQQAYDSLNRLIRVIDAGSGIVKSTYDQHDRPVTVVDQNSGSTTYVYDGFGNVIQRISPDTGKTVFYYDLAGNRTQNVDASGATTNNTYDALDRVLTTTYPADPAENVAYHYDETGHGFGTGRLTSLSDAVGTLSRSYDERGNILSESRVRSGTTLLTSYAYDKASRVSSVTYPSGWGVSYARDIMGRVTGINALQPGGGTPQTVIASVGYQPFGPVSGLTYGNGIGETRSFDLDYRAKQISSSGSAAVQNLTYGYDSADNVLSITDGITSGNSQSLGYDVLNRLTGASGPYGTLGYTYTAIGNRATQTAAGLTTSYTYAAHSSQLTAIKTGAITQTVGNTATGNVNSFSPALGSVTALTYNQANRLATTSAGSSQLTQYTYDAFGHRLIKVGATTATTLYQYDGAGHLLEEADGSGNGQVDYVYLGDRPVATIQPSNSKIYFLHDDRLGTPQMATDNTQAVAWATTYQPFGQISTPPAIIAQDLRLPGQENDLETGLYHNGFRDYVPGLGRYIESDPIGLLGGINSYGYVGQNPVRGFDISGLSDLSLFSPSDPIYAYDQRTTGPAGIFTVGGHGDPVYIYGPKGAPIPPYQLADMIRADPRYKKGEPVQLNSCATGGNPPNGYSPTPFAQNLANELNAPVTAATNKVYFYSNGTTVVGQPGQWITFQPSHP